MNIREYYFPDILRKINLAMLGLFGGYQVAKRDRQGSIIEYRNVPVRFAHRQKFIPLLTTNKEGNITFFYQNLPVMGLMLKSMQYAPEKVRGGYNAPIYKWFDEAVSSNKQMFSGTPYTLTYSLAILSLHMSEMSMILEQMLPQFNTFRNITITEWDFLPELTRDLKVNLKSTTPNFMDEVAEDQMKRVEFTLEFEIDAFLYKPIPIVELIKTVKIPWIDWTSTTNPVTADLTTYAVSGDSLADMSVLEDYTWPTEISVEPPIEGGSPDEVYYGGDPAGIHGGTPGSTFDQVGGLPYGNVTLIDGGEEI